MKKSTKQFLAKIMTFVMLFSLMTFPVSATDNRVVLDKQAVQTTADIGAREAEVTLSVTGNPVSKPADIVLVLDKSGSMKNKPIADLKTAANLFTSKVLSVSGSRVAVVSYSETAVVNSGFSSSVSGVQSVINGLGASGATNMHAGMVLAKALLDQSSSTNKAVVFMSDGEPTKYLNRDLTADRYSYRYDYRTALSSGVPYLQYGRGVYNYGWQWSWNNSAYTNSVIGAGSEFDVDAKNAMLASAQSIKDAGVQLFAIGLLKSNQTDAINTLKSAASTGSYYQTPDSDDLEALFTKVSNRLGVAAKNGIVTDIVPQEYSVISGSFKVDGVSVTANETGSPVQYSTVGSTGRIIWTIGNITKENTTLSYRVAGKSPYAGAYSTNESAVLSMIYDGDTATSTKEFRVPAALLRPYVANDQYVATAGVATTIPAADGILKNDQNTFNASAGGWTASTLTPSVTQQPMYGTVNVMNDGSFTYTGVDSETPYMDTFQYVLRSTADMSGAGSRNLTSDTATVTLVVNPKVRFPLTISSDGNGNGNWTTDPTQPPTGYVNGTEVTVTAIPSVGSSFTGWSGAVNSTDSEISVTMSQAQSLTATFTLDKVDLTVTTIGGGTVTKSPEPVNGQYDYGTTVELTAVPQNGWRFAGWSVDASGSDAQTSVLMNGSKNVTATFVRENYLLTTAVTGKGTIEVDPTSETGRYPYETAVGLTAVAGTGWHFVEWQGDATPDAEQGTKATVAMTGAKSVTAVFAIDTHLLTVNKVGFGTTTRDVAADADGRYNYGTTVVLTAVPAAGSMFIEWQDAEGNSLGSDPLTVLMDKDVTVKAVFKSLHNLDIEIIGNGDVTKTPGPDDAEGDYLEGTAVTLTATPDTGWHFVGYSANVVGDVVTMNGPQKVIATFEIDKHLLTVTQEGLGSIEPTNPSGLYDYNTDVALKAVPATGQHFVGWTGDVVSTDTDISVTMDKDKAVKATFAPDQHTLDITIVGDGSVNADPEPGDDDLYDYGTVVTLTAEAAANWHFVRWEGVDGKDGETATITINADKEVTAVFAKDTYNLTVHKTGQGTVTEGGVFDYGTVVDLTADPETGWHFDSWEGVDSRDGSDAQVTINGNREVRAIFVQDQYTLTITHDHGSVSKTKPNGDDEKYLSGTEVAMVATADEGYHFVRWEGAEAVENEGGIDQATVLMDGDKEVAAVFEINTYELTTAVSGLGTVDAEVVEGTLTEDDTYEHGTIVELTATAGPDFHFVRWTGDVEGNEPTIQVTMTSDKTVTAIFEKTIYYYPLTINKVGQGTVVAEPGPTEETYEAGTEVTLTATPEAGWRFIGWSGDVSGSAQSVTVTMNGTRVVTATFEQVGGGAPGGGGTGPGPVTPAVVNVPDEEVPLAAPIVPQEVVPVETPAAIIEEDVVPLGVPVLPKTGETDSMFFYLLGLGLIGAGVMNLRRKESN